MGHPVLAFCPYLDLSGAVEFGDWELGPAAHFESRWADETFKAKAAAFLAKFVDGNGTPIKNPALLCRRGGQIDGAVPAVEEMEALSSTLAFAFLDENPRRTAASAGQSWKIVTTDNTEPNFWPVDLETGNVATTSGLMVSTISGGFTVDDPKLIIRPPLDLHQPLAASLADANCLDAVYTVIVGSLRAPGVDPRADRIKTAIHWLAKAWRNTRTVDFADRVVHLKTGFEAITGTSKSRDSAALLRALFERLPGTTAGDADLLVWSPTETPVHAHTVRGKTEQVTDLEFWFMAFADARNTIIHEGRTPPLTFSSGNPSYDGHFVFTAEFLLRAVVKASLADLGYPDLWRSATWRAIKAAVYSANGTSGPSTA